MEIHYIHEPNLDTNDPILRKVLEFCSGKDISVKFRLFDPREYDEDREYITRIPAIQIYKRKLHEDTIYPDFKPIQFLQLEYDKFQLEEFEREAKKQIWEERIKHLRNLFRSLKTDSTSSNLSHK